MHLLIIIFVFYSFYFIFDSANPDLNIALFWTKDGIKIEAIIKRLVRFGAIAMACVVCTETVILRIAMREIPYKILWMSNKYFLSKNISINEILYFVFVEYLERY